MLSLLAPPPAAPQPVFHKVMDAGTPLPGAPEGARPVVSFLAGDRVVFLAEPAGSLSGDLFTTTASGFERIGWRGMKYPGTPGPLQYLPYPSVAPGCVAFEGRGPGLWDGYFLRRDGELELVYDSTRPYPGSELGALLGRPDTDCETLAFTITVDLHFLNPRGVYTLAPGGGVRPVAEMGTPIPETDDTFYYLRPGVEIDQGGVVFHGLSPGGEAGGLYLGRDGRLEALVDHRTPVPGEGAARFSDLRAPALDGERLAFVGEWRDAAGGRHSGVFVRDGAGVRRVADTGTLAPGPQAHPFEAFGDPSIDGDRVAFAALTAAGVGVYVEAGVVLRRVMAVGDLLDGERVEEVESAFDALSGDRVVFRARLAGGTDGIWVARLDMPPPGSEPPPPPGDDWLETPDVPGYRMQVRISGGGEARTGRAEAACVPETLCVSGAVPGRTELMVRIVGPKPNGFLWPTLVKLSTATVEVWIEQTATGALRHYRLEGAAPGVDELPGLFDRTGFLPPG